MASGIEIEIQQLLLNIGEPAMVADELVKKWHRDELNDDDLELVAHFLLKFGFHAALCENLAVKLVNNFKIPWSVMLPLIEASPQKPDHEVINQILIGAGEQKGLEDFLRHSSAEKLEPRLKSVRDKIRSEMRQNLRGMRQSLMDQALVFKNDQMPEKEREVLQRLIELDPTDEEARELYAEFATRQARSAISRRTHWTDQEEIYKRKADQLSPEMKLAAKELSQQLLKKAKKLSKSAYDISVSLFLMGDVASAIEALRYAPSDMDSDWLMADLLLEGNRFVDVLTHLDALEIKYASDASIVPATLYARAKALWGLHQFEAAVDLLENLVKVKPDYRSAHSLLMHWKESLQ